MSMTVSKEKSFNFKKIGIIAFCLMFCDAFVFGIPSVGLIVLFLIVCVSGISAFIGIWRDKKYARLYAVKASIYFIALMGIFGIFKFNSNLGEKNAQRIIKAVNTYYADKGHYPEKLNQLIPIYLDRIPRCAYRITDSQYRYFSDPGDPNLMWAVAPPFGRRIYHFKNAKWGSLD